MEKLREFKWKTPRADGSMPKVPKGYMRVYCFSESCIRQGGPRDRRDVLPRHYSLDSHMGRRVLEQYADIPVAPVLPKVENEQ